MTRTLCAGYAISLRACYAKPGTDLAYGAFSLRNSYASPGTDVVYVATRKPVLIGRMVLREVQCCLRARYEKPGTDLLYGATRWRRL
eukprot:3940404-Rhodomonas_salina.4